MSRLNTTASPASTWLGRVPRRRIANRQTSASIPSSHPLPLIEDRQQSNQTQSPTECRGAPFGSAYERRLGGANSDLRSPDRLPHRTTSALPSLPAFIAPDRLAPVPQQADAPHCVRGPRCDCLVSKGTLGDEGTQNSFKAGQELRGALARLTRHRSRWRVF